MDSKFFSCCAANKTVLNRGQNSKYLTYDHLAHETTFFGPNYTQAKKTVNTENVPGMFIVF